MWIRGSGICACCAGGPLPVKSTCSWRARLCSICQRRTKSRSTGFLIPYGIDSHEPGEESKNREGKRGRGADRKREKGGRVESLRCYPRAQQDQRKGGNPRPK